MIQTSYVPLEHPFQIIEYNGTLGIQIGTLIVTVDKSDDVESGYAIETHSHPVVSYINNRIRPERKTHKSLSLPRPFEGVVWNKVELHQLRTLVREDEPLSWNALMDYCRRVRISELDGVLKNADAIIMDNYGVLLDWGIDINLPKNQLGVEVKPIATYANTEYLIMEGDLGVVVRYGDKSLMMRQIFAQCDFFLSLMSYYDLADREVKFWTEDLFMQDLTKELNEEWEIHRRPQLSFHQDDDGIDEGLQLAADDDDFEEVR